MFARFCEENNVTFDEVQLALIHDLERYKKQIDRLSNSLLDRVFVKLKTKELRKQGMYIHGDVGRGKSMLLGLFFESLQTKRKLKVHFHEFMQDIHKSLHKWREKNSYTSKAYDPIPEIAGKIADKYTVICFDELQVNNIADAMILHRLFQVFFNRNIFIFFTSNQAPGGLFKDGLQREQFLPFIDLVNKRLDVFELNNYQDYRLAKIAGLTRAFIYPVNKQTSHELENVVYDLTGHAQKNHSVIVAGSGKAIHALNIYGKLAEFTFAELCMQPLGAIDYLSLSHQFSTVIIHNIPKLSQDEHNEALRFITLVDCLYESKTILICLSAIAPDHIYSVGKNAFEFKRTVSRLYEMSGHEYLTNAGFSL
ncbi:MAG: cell division protein ZapE [Rickettsiales bacterium]